VQHCDATSIPHGGELLALRLPLAPALRLVLDFLGGDEQLVA
jgi:hypothetical protein